MLTKVQKWGNSLGLRIPKSFAQEASIEEGSTVDLSVSDGNLVVRPIQQEKYALKALLAGITEENLHAEISTGERQGREAW